MTVLDYLPEIRDGRVYTRTRIDFQTTEKQLEITKEYRDYLEGRFLREQG